jgi:hypothetical protein
MDKASVLRGFLEQIDIVIPDAHKGNVTESSWLKLDSLTKPYSGNHFNSLLASQNVKFG